MSNPADDLDLPDRIAAAQALNRLSHALVRHRAAPDVLRRIALAADQLAADIEDQPVRQRRMELVNAPEYREAIEAGRTQIRDEGAFVDMFEDSPVSGSANPLTMGMRVGREGDEAVTRAVIQAGFQGAPERAHGGIVAAMVDECMGAVLPIVGVVAFTGELTLRYEGPCPMGVPIEFRARKTGQDGRKLYLSCEGSSEVGGIFMRAHATFISIDLSQFRGAG